MARSTGPSGAGPARSGVTLLVVATLAGGAVTADDPVVVAATRPSWTTEGSVGEPVPSLEPVPRGEPSGPEPGSSGSGVPAPGAEYAWPLHPPPVVLTPFHAPEHPYGPGHRGVDLVADPGQPVLPAREGVVVFAGPVGGRGVVSVEHEDGLRTTYEPLRPVVTRGTRVRRGEVLGVVSGEHTGCTSPCLHWGVRRDRLTYLDPLVLLRPPRVRLLPLSEP